MGAGVRWLAFMLAWCFTQAGAQPAAFEGVALRDQRSQAVSPAWLQGPTAGLLLVNFIYTGCSTTCPLQVRELAEMQRQLPAAARAGLRVLSVSVDPANDTPATLADFARRMGAADLAGWRFATGSVAQVDKLIDRFQVLDKRKASPQPEDHRTSLYLFNAQGALLQRYRGVPVDRARLADEITRLQSAAVAQR